MCQDRPFAAYQSAGRARSWADFRSLLRGDYFAAGTRNQALGNRLPGQFMVEFTEPLTLK
jgi:hypothetical protein